MKLKSLFSLTVAIAAILFIVSCEDNIGTIGQGIQPGGDDIQMEIDSVFLTAETVKLDPSVYLPTEGTLLGMLDDPIVGRTKAEFLAEFFYANGKFELGYDNKAKIDSVFFTMYYHNSAITGDSLSTMGVSIYELNKNLKSNFYTNVKPSDYSDMQTILGQRYFRHVDLDKIHDSSTGKEYGKLLYIEMEKSFGQKLYDAWVEDPDVLKNSANLKRVLKGIYVTSDFNNKALIETYDAKSQMEVLICYSYKTKKKNDVNADSTVLRTLPLQIGGDVLQLNSIIDTPATLADDKDENGWNKKSYVKAPAGVVTKITIPIGKIRRQAEQKSGKNYIINSSVFTLAGMTEEETKLSITNRPSTMLFINKDSIQNFFSKSKKIENESLMMMFRHTRSDESGNVTGSNNTYHFNVQNTTSKSNNISSLINHYIDVDKNKDVKRENLEFYLIPVDVQSSATSSGFYQIDKISNSLTPSAAIFRTDKANMRMSLLFSRYNQ